jgi:hypothetical protein
MLVIYVGRCGRVPVIFGKKGEDFTPRRSGESAALFSPSFCLLFVRAEAHTLQRKTYFRL